MTLNCNQHSVWSEWKKTQQKQPSHSLLLFRYIHTLYRWWSLTIDNESHSRNSKINNSILYIFGTHSIHSKFQRLHPLTWAYFEMAVLCSWIEEEEYRHQRWWRKKNTYQRGVSASTNIILAAHRIDDECWCVASREFTHFQSIFFCCSFETTIMRKNTRNANMR